MAGELDTRFEGLPAIASLLPLRSSAHEPLHQHFDFERVAQLEELGQTALFELEHRRFVAIAAISPRKGRPGAARQALKPLPEPGQAVASGCSWPGRTSTPRLMRRLATK